MSRKWPRLFVPAKRTVLKTALFVLVSAVALALAVFLIDMAAGAGFARLF